MKTTGMGSKSWVEDGMRAAESITDRTLGIYRGVVVATIAKSSSMITMDGSRTLTPTFKEMRGSSERH